GGRGRLSLFHFQDSIESGRMQKKEQGYLRDEIIKQSQMGFAALAFVAPSFNLNHENSSCFTEVSANLADSK
ncbi:hypothetical protein Ancab_025486, partial [Ancistrocladus abbreviatus]